MNKIVKVKSISIWIFIVPFVAVNACLIVTTQFHSIIESQQYRLPNMFPYLDGQASISRTARFFPTYWIFKPAMFLTSYFLIRYWLYNRNIISFFDSNNANIKKFVYFGIASAIALTIHSIFLGIKFDNDLYKLFRRVIMLLFIIFEIVAQAYLVITLYKLKEKFLKYINLNFLKLKAILVSTLIIVAIASIPIISFPGNIHIKHALEWNYFVGVIGFYLLTFFMWKNEQ